MLRIGAVVIRGQFESGGRKNTIRHLLGGFGLDGINAGQIVSGEIEFFLCDVSVDILAMRSTTSFVASTVAEVRVKVPAVKAPA